MPINDTCEHIVAIVGAVSGIRAGIDPPPAQLDTGKFPACYVLAEQATDTEDLGSDMRLETRAYSVHVAVIPKGQVSIVTAQDQVRALIPPVKTALASYPQLNAAPLVQNARVEGDSGVIVLPTYDEKFIGFEVRLSVTEYVKRAYAAYE